MANKLEIKLRYTCAAYPPIGVDMNNSYTLGKDKDGFYYSCGEDKYWAELWFIKMLFTPIDKSWNEVDKLISGL